MFLSIHDYLLLKLNHSHS